MVERTPNNNENLAPKKNKGEIAKFLQSFSNEYIRKEISRGNHNVLRDIMNAPSIDENILSLLQRFQASKDQFSDIELGDINIHQLKSKVARFFVERNKNEKRLFTYLQTNFELDDSDKFKIKTTLENLSDAELKNYYGNSLRASQWLRSLLGKSEIEINKGDLFPSLTNSEIQKRINKLPKESQDDILALLGRIRGSFKIDPSDAELLAHSGFLSSIELRELVHEYIPHISLEQAANIGIISANEAENKKKEIIRKNFGGAGLDAETLAAIESSVGLEDIDLYTSQLNLTTQQYRDIAKVNNFSQLAQEIENEKENIKEDLYKNGPKSLKELQTVLGALSNGNTFEINAPANFTTGSFVKIQPSNPQEGIVNGYIKITNFDDNKKKLYFETHGSEGVRLNNPGPERSIDYVTLVENIKNSKTPTQMDVYTKEQIEQLVASGKIPRSSADYYTKDDLENNGSLRDSLIDTEKEKIEKEIQSLEVQRGADGNLPPEVEGKRNKLKAKLEKLEDNSNNSDYLLGLSNKDNLLKELDSIDEKGKRVGLSKGMGIIVPEGYGKEEGTFYEVKGVDYNNWTLILGNSFTKDTQMDLSSFMDSMKKFDAYRVPNLQTQENLVKNLSTTKTSTFWEDVKIKDNKLIKPLMYNDGKKRNFYNIQYFTASGDKGKMLEVKSIDNDKVVVKLGDFKKGKKDDKPHYELGLKGGLEKHLSLREFAELVKLHKLTPNQDLNVQTEDSIIEDKENEDFHGSFASRLFNNFLSISDLIVMGNSIVDTVKNNLEKGSKTRAAKAALKLGKFLPKELRMELIMDVEAAETEAMEKEVDKLNKIGSTEATELIKEWVLNDDAPQFQKEAGMMFMIGKYGRLNAKAMKKWQGKYIWYQAMGGRIGDPIYNKYINESQIHGHPVSEEDMIFEMLSEQGKGNHYSGIKRRSKINKKFMGEMVGGVDKEYNDGKEDAASKAAPELMLENGMGEARGGTIPNALGNFDVLVDAGANPVLAQHGYFALVYSGILADSWQAIPKKAFEKWTKGNPLPILRFMKTKADMAVFNRTVRDLAVYLSQEYPDKYPDAGVRAQKLYDDALTGNGNSPDRIQAAYDFWADYGEPLNRALIKNVDSDPDLAKMDAAIDTLKDSNPNIKTYDDALTDDVMLSMAFGDKKIIQSNFPDYGGIGMDINSIVSTYFKLNSQGAFVDKSVANPAWKRIVSDINNTHKKVLVGDTLDSPANYNAQIEHITKMLEQVVAGMYGAGGSANSLKNYQLLRNVTGPALNSWGVSFEEIGYDVPVDTIKDGGKRSIFEKYARNILSKGGNIDVTSSFSSTDDIITPDILQATQRVNQNAVSASSPVIGQGQSDNISTRNPVQGINDTSIDEYYDDDISSSPVI